MAKSKTNITSSDAIGNDSCAHILEGVDHELQRIRATLSSVSLEEAKRRSAEMRARPVQPLRDRPAGSPPPLPANPEAHQPAKRTLAERLQRALGS